MPKPIVKIESPKIELAKPEIIKEYKKIWNELIETHRAIEEVQSIRFDTVLTTETKNITTPNKETGTEEKNKFNYTKTNLHINKKSFDALHSFTKSVLSTSNLSNNNFNTVD